MKITGTIPQRGFHGGTYHGASAFHGSVGSSGFHGAGAGGGGGAHH